MLLAGETLKRTLARAMFFPGIEKSSVTTPTTGVLAPRPVKWSNRLRLRFIKCLISIRCKASKLMILQSDAVSNRATNDAGHPPRTLAKQSTLNRAETSLELEGVVLTDEAESSSFVSLLLR